VEGESEGETEGRRGFQGEPLLGLPLGRSPHVLRGTGRDDNNPKVQESGRDDNSPEGTSRVQPSLRREEPCR
jgi:hypothetical protein